MARSDEFSEITEQVPRETWPGLPDVPQLLGPTVPNLTRKFFIDSPTTLFKFGGTEGEGKMTMFARSILGPCVPRITTFVTIAAYSRPGFVLTRQEGRPIEEVWPSLTTPQREGIKTELCSLILRMRAQTFSTTVAHLGSQWDDSRIKALHAAKSDTVHAVRLELEKVQRNTNGPVGWDCPVLTHVDLSDRNILVDPDTLKVTGFLDWEMANIMPAYFEYVSARLTGGHDPPWRKEILDVLRSLLRHECDARATNAEEGEAMYTKTLAAWDAMTDVERNAQGYSDDCYWTFETGLPGDVTGPGAAL